MAKLRNCANGLARFWPAISGADPCTGSYIALGRPVSGSGAPNEAEGSIPRDPVSIAAQSDSKSPNRLSVTMTSNCFGFRTSCIAQLSAYIWPRLTSPPSCSCRLFITSRHSTPDIITFDFSTDVTRPSRLRAKSNATRPIRSISRVE